MTKPKRPRSRADIEPIDYTLAFRVPQIIRDYKHAATEYVHDAFGLPLQEASEAHMTIKVHLEFSPHEAHELCSQLRTLVARKRLASSAHVFPVSVFPKSNVIYLGVGGPILETWHFLIDWFARCGYKKKGFEGETLHVTLAKPQLEPALLRDAHFGIANLPITRSLPRAFLVDELMLYGMSAGKSVRSIIKL